MRAQELSDTVSRTYPPYDEFSACFSVLANEGRTVARMTLLNGGVVVKETRFGSEESSYRVAQSALMELIENEIDFTSTIPDQCFPTASHSLSSFQVTCGLAAGYFLDIQQTPDNDPSGSRSHFNAYCEKHSDEARQRAKSDPSQSISSSDDDSSSSSSGLSSAIPLTVYRRDQLKQEKWIPDCLARFSTFVSASHLHEQSTQDYDASISEQIYQYWIRKRQMNRTMPLIERIDYVLEQRDNAELLTLQIDRCLEIRRAMLHVRILPLESLIVHEKI